MSGRKPRYCDDCLAQIAERLGQEDLLILKFLVDNRARSANLSMDKTKIIPAVKGLTEFKFNFSMRALELCGLVQRTTKGRLHKYYATADGKRALKLYLEMLREDPD